MVAPKGDRLHRRVIVYVIASVHFSFQAKGMVEPWFSLIPSPMCVLGVAMVVDGIFKSE
jgi:hypothetical protein